MWHVAVADDAVVLVADDDSEAKIVLHPFSYPQPDTIVTPRLARGLSTWRNAMQITAEMLSKIAGRPANENMASVIDGLQMAGVGAGLNRPHRLAMYLGQLAHESMGFHYDREIWGPTAAQRRYDTRTDLGNTAAADGDGYLYRGRGPIQITGKSNYYQFTQWAKARSSTAPDFVVNPDAVNSDPWEGLGPIWYWDTRSLNDYADRGDYDTVTRRINGGTNGLADRRRLYGRAALVLMGHNADAVKYYQSSRGLAADGAVGPKTIAAMHADLAKLPILSFGTAPASTPTTSAAPAGVGIIAALAGIAALIFGAFK